MYTKVFQRYENIEFKTKTADRKVSHIVDPNESDGNKSILAAEIYY